MDHVLLPSKPFKIGDIVRYSHGLSAIAKLVEKHPSVNDGWYGIHVLSKTSFFLSEGFGYATQTFMQHASNDDLEYCKRAAPHWFDSVMSRQSSLTIKELVEKNIKRCMDGKGFNHELNEWSIAEWTNAAAGEMGEACNIAKKMIRLRDDIKGNDPKLTRNDLKKKLAQELSDTIIYIVLTAASEDIDLEKSIIDTFNNKSDEIGSDIKL